MPSGYAVNATRSFWKLSSEIAVGLESSRRSDTYTGKIEDLVLKRCRSNAKGYNKLGDFHAMSFRKNFVGAKHVDAETCGKEIGVLKPYEELAN